MNLVLKEIRDLLQTNLTTSFKRYYVGKIKTPPESYLPILMVHGISTSQIAANSTTSKDHYKYKVEISIIENVYNYVTTNGVESDLVLKTQQAVRNKLEERETTGVPKATSILGVLRRNIPGTNYRFNHNIEISYEEFMQNG